MTEPCCPEFARLSRRGLFSGAVALAGATTVVGSAVVRASAATTPARAVLVVLSLRGAADGLSLAVPYGDTEYAAARPTIQIPQGQLVATDGFFGLHPKLAPLLPLWDERKLAVVHATGLRVPNRSHFAAMEEIEDSDPLSNVRAGWLNRLIGLDNSSSPLQAFNLAGGVPPASLYGTQDTISAPDVDSMRVSAVDQWDHGRRMRSLHRLWDGSSTPMGRAMRATFRAVADFEPVRKTPEQPANGATYPDDDLGRALREVARIVRGNVGVEVVTVDHGDWDHHTELGTLEWGRMIGNASALGESIAAFFQDLGQLGDKVTLVTISEFGRRVKENANQGLDHGWGNVMFLAGAGVKGGKYYADWPWLENTDDADLQVTTDYRSVLSEVIESRFGVSASHVFTDSRFQRETVGVMAGFGAG